MPPMDLKHRAQAMAVRAVELMIPPPEDIDRERRVFAGIFDATERARIVKQVQHEFEKQDIVNNARDSSKWMLHQDDEK